MPGESQEERQQVLQSQISLGIPTRGSLTPPVGAENTPPSFNASSPGKAEEPSAVERVLASRFFFNRRILLLCIWEEQVKSTSQCSVKACIREIKIARVGLGGE